MYCKECGKIINEKVKFCKFCGTKQTKAFIDNSNIEKKNNQPEEFTEKVNYSAISGNTKTYPEVLFAGIIYLLFQIYSFASPEFKYTLQKNPELALLIIFSVQVGLIIWSVSIAKKLNRNRFGWGLFTFLIPSISLIILGVLSPKKNKIKYSQTKFGYNELIATIGVIIIITGIILIIGSELGYIVPIIQNNSNVKQNTQTTKYKYNEI